jgi:acetate CoA/acetoacetate CoA-transferase alpha subunit
VVFVTEFESARQPGYALTARNLNPLMAMATEIVLAEAQNIVPVGVIPPDAVMTPAVLVDHLISKEGRNG